MRDISGDVIAAYHLKIYKVFSLKLGFGYQACLPGYHTKGYKKIGDCLIDVICFLQASLEERVNRDE